MSHAHSDHSETFTILDGDAVFIVDGRKSLFKLKKQQLFRRELSVL